MTVDTTKPELKERATQAIIWLTQDEKNSTGEVIRRAVLNVPGVRAEIGRCLKFPLEHPNSLRAFRHLEPYLPEHSSLGEERAFFTVCAMVCKQPSAGRSQDLKSPRVDGPGNATLGTSLAHAVDKRVQSDQAAEHRLLLLGRQNLDGIHRLLPRTVLHLRGTRVPVDWPRLIEDLASWSQRRPQIAKRWIQEYHRTRSRLATQREAAKLETSESETP